MTTLVYEHTESIYEMCSWMCWYISGWSASLRYYMIGLWSCLSDLENQLSRGRSDRSRHHAVFQQSFAVLGWSVEFCPWLKSWLCIRLENGLFPLMSRWPNVMFPISPFVCLFSFSSYLYTIFSLSVIGFPNRSLTIFNLSLSFSYGSLVLSSLEIGESVENFRYIMWMGGEVEVGVWVLSDTGRHEARERRKIISTLEKQMEWMMESDEWKEVIRKSRMEDHRTG